LSPATPHRLTFTVRCKFRNMNHLNPTNTPKKPPNAQGHVLTQDNIERFIFLFCDGVWPPVCSTRERFFSFTTPDTDTVPIKIVLVFLLFFFFLFSFWFWPNHHHHPHDQSINQSIFLLRLIVYNGPACTVSMEFARVWPNWISVLCIYNFRGYWSIDMWNGPFAFGFFALFSDSVWDLGLGFDFDFDLWPGHTSYVFTAAHVGTESVLETLQVCCLGFWIMLVAAKGRTETN